MINQALHWVFLGVKVGGVIFVVLLMHQTLVATFFNLVRVVKSSLLLTLVKRLMIATST